MKQDKLIKAILMAVALSAIGGLGLITLFIFKEGLPIILQIGVADFFCSTDWSPGEQRFGILSMIVGSVAVTLGAMAIGVVFSLGLAIVLTQFCPPKVAGVLKPLIELLAGIPSVVYGFIGMVTIIPLIREYVGGPGFSVLAASIVLGIMVLPTVTSISIDALNAVPRSFWEGSVALGATRWQTTHMLLLKAARSGILAAIILGMGRAIGETMAVIMVTGNSLEIPRAITDPVRTLTSNIALEMNYATGQHRKALFATGVTLFIIIMALNTLAMAVSRRRVAGGGNR
ncbi:MAG TPA: phosphate ABC transporter permease subunit PstC [Phycisphaerae bacterium]|jgi:phosphate ABC transporter permease protein PstC|nr:phosphate ABC transporter permease subunit PstC [Phycisphaerae bacterium]HOB76607.1 phosphate ABC transporter permease subunit PstC [Phycisphaerae bacterium]HOJ54793.1 phosphate ABC transporter permease subunit PstC [Phycisphaerae bacterium]HOL26929.1 phosphate ABC transporter permease subunit PstC [Phycisphaerae bacterium]HPP20884.1 phosphate ABC transporter permease subunit PstC [Phycisphaerae bacterium]